MDMMDDAQHKDKKMSDEQVQSWVVSIHRRRGRLFMSLSGQEQALQCGGGAAFVL